MIDSCTSRFSLGFKFFSLFFLVSSPSRHANVGLTDLMVGEAAQRRMWQGTHSSAVHISHFKHSVGQVEHLRGAPGSEVSVTSWVPSSICFRLAGHLRPPSPHLWPHERREHLARDHLASYPCDGFCQTSLACHRCLVACRIRTSGDIPGRCIVFFQTSLSATADVFELLQHKDANS